MRYGCISIKIRIWNNDKTKYLKDMRRQATLIYWERQNDTNPLERIWWFLIQLNILAPYDLATALLGICPKVLEKSIQIKTCTSMFLETLFIITKIWKQSRHVSVDECINCGTVKQKLLFRGI